MLPDLAAVKCEESISCCGSFAKSLCGAARCGHRLLTSGDKPSLQRLQESCVGGVIRRTVLGRMPCLATCSSSVGRVVAVAKCDHRYKDAQFGWDCGEIRLG